MKEKYFDNPENTIEVLKTVINKRRNQLNLTIKNLEDKGDKALPPDEMAVYAAKLDLELAEKKLADFEKELESRQIQPY